MNAKFKKTEQTRKRRLLFDTQPKSILKKTKSSLPDQDYGLAEPLDELISQTEIDLKKDAFLKSIVLS